MSYYQILDRPEGTYPFKQSVGTQLSGISRAGAKGMTDMIFRKAAEREGMTPSYKRTAPGEWDVGYEMPKKEDFKEKMMLYLAGFAPPPKGVEKQVEEVAPFKVGEAGGGEVMTPFGTTAEGGYYKDPGGKTIGEYAPGAEGERMPGPVRTQLRSEISGDEYARKVFGLPRKTLTVEEKAKEAVALTKKKEEFAGPKEKKWTSKERYLISAIKQMKEQNASIEEIRDKIFLEKHAPEDFEEFLRGYVPKRKEGFRWPWTD